jgi:hypothetical protein
LTANLNTTRTGSDSSDDERGRRIHQHAFIEQFSIDAGGGISRLLMRTGTGGPGHVNAINAIVELIGIMRSYGCENTTRLTSSLLARIPYVDKIIK